MSRISLKFTSAFQMRSLRRRSLVLVLTLIVVGSVAHAQDDEWVTPPPAPTPAPSPTPEPQKASDKFPEMTWERKFILGNISVSKWFDGVAEGLDRYLVERQLTTKANETSVELENTTSWIRGKNVDNSASININLRLPNVEEYWHLKFTSYDEIEERRTARRGILRQNQREKNYGATIGLFKRLGNVRTAFQPRIEASGGISHSLTFESMAETKTMQVNPKLEFYATQNKGAGSSQALNFHFPLTKIYSLTLINQADYQDRIHLYLTNIGASIGQAITEKSGFGYGVMFDGTNQPNYHLMNYSLSVSWSEILYRKILDYQLTTYVSFPEAEGFAGVPGIILTINLLF